MNASRWIGILFGIGLMVWAGNALAGYGALWLLKAATVILVLPWIAACATSSPAELLGAAVAGLGGSGDASRSAVVLQRLANLTFATGAMVGMLSLVASLHDIAMRGGQGNPAELIGAIGRMFVPLLFGLSLRFFVYDVLAAGLERTGREAT